MPRKPTIAKEAGILVSVRLSPVSIALLDVIAARDGFDGRSALIRESITNELEARVEHG